MKKLFYFAVVCVLALFFIGCQRTDYGELSEGSGRRGWNEIPPLGMNFVHQGSFNLGPNDEEIFISATPSKTVSVDAFWMDDTEITNFEYRQFVNWVRDSIARRMLGDQYPEFLISEDSYGNPISTPIINWNERIDWNDPDTQTAMENLYVPENERFFGKKEIDPRGLTYEYWWIDYQQAAKRANSYNFGSKKYEGSVYNAEGEIVPIENRSSFIVKDAVYVYPDTLCWIRDFTYSYNDPRTQQYFWHPGFAEYPVVGVTWKQARAFCNWRTKYRNDFLHSKGQIPASDYRLPTEAEWEFAARGGRQNLMYPWGSYYTREKYGIFMANFKPRRGNYVEDGGLATMNVRSYEPNDFGLYDMSGNVAEWTSNAYDESTYDIIYDFNPNYIYNAKTDDAPAMKRKVVRGGSWKDVAYFQRVATRSYEYQDSCNSYVGFRCVMSSICDVSESSFWRK